MQIGGKITLNKTTIQKILKTLGIKRGTMYDDAIQRLNFHVGCKFKCKYCVPTFQRQMKRQKQNCIDCYHYVPHLHLDRLEDYLYHTTGDKFIWLGASSDISFCPKHAMQEAVKVTKRNQDRTFFFQTKNPSYFHGFKFPDNVLLCITLETDKDHIARQVSLAPAPSKRVKDFKELEHPHKVITIEPIMTFHLKKMKQIILDQIKPERVYIGYDSHPDYSNLIEPRLEKTLALIKAISKHTNIKTKEIRFPHLHQANLTQWGVN